MTTHIKLRILALLVMLVLGNSSFSQTQNLNNLPVSVSNISYGKTYSKVSIQFQNLFPNAENVTFSTHGKNIRASFTMNGQWNRVMFDKKARLLYKITYGNEKLLPTEVRKMAKRHYVEFGITGVTLVEQDNRQIWLINLEDDAEYVVARIESGELNESLKYRKS